MTRNPTYKADISAGDFPAKGSRLVMGTSGLGGVWGAVKEEESVQCILTAMENGISSFDTAPSYANAEYYLGKAFKRWKGELPFVSTKVGRLKADTAFDARLDYSSKGMKDSVRRSLDLLGIDKVSLIFLHEPQWAPLDRMDEILDCLASFKEDGFTDMLGIGGNPSAAFMPYVSKRYFQVLSTFCRMDACNLSAFEDILPICKKENIFVYAASSLHFSLLGNRYQQFIQQHPGYAEISRSDVQNAFVVNKIAKRLGMSLPSLAQRYLFSIAEASRIVVGASTMEQVAHTLNDWNAGALPEDIFNEITTLITNPCREAHLIL
jgi:aryl-alcohol dehydrogenase-like predicted oxidoreductase